MTPADIDRVFGRGRLRMVTGDHVEVYREAALPGERRRYTKRFLATAAGDFRQWTEREWRILARLVGHGIGPVPDVVQFDRGAADRPALVQTYDAGVTVDHWATLLPVQRDGGVVRHVFEDCAHWWALARHCLIALDAIHELQLVHLDLKADNVCIPLGPVDFDPHAPGQVLRPCFEQIVLIDFAFSLVFGESLNSALPIGRQADYHYQSPRLLQALEAGSRGDLLPTRQLDWRCDVFSLAAMLRRYLPDPDRPLSGDWTTQRYAQARALVRRLLQAHDAERPAQRPHVELISLATQALEDDELAASLSRGWTLATSGEMAFDAWRTPITRIALPISAAVDQGDVRIADLAHTRLGPDRKRSFLWLAGLVAAVAIGGPLLVQTWAALHDRSDAGGHSAEPPMSAPAGQVLASAPAALATAARVAERSVDTPLPRADRARLEPDPAPATATTPATAASEAAPDTAAPAPRLPSPVQRPAKPERGAAPSGQAPANAPAAATARVVPRSPTRVIAQPAVRPPVRATAPLSERERALAWLSSRGPSPRFAQPSGPTSLRVPAPAAADDAPTAPVATPAAAAPAATPAAAAPATPAARVPVPVPVPAAAIRLPAPPPADFIARASDLMTNQVPRLAQRAASLVQRVLNVADRPDSASWDDEIRSAASAVRLAPDDPVLEGWVDANEARLLNEAAAVALRRGGSLQEALGLQTKAFGANPLDPDIARNLALLQLRQRPPQAGAARQLALNALIIRDPGHLSGRIDDWTALAIASALSGRDRDARNAWLVSVALAPGPERQCKAAINAYARYGEGLRSSVEAMLYHVHSTGRSERSVFCEWPAHWMAVNPMR